MTKNIVLIGLMGSGKTTVGKIIAENLSRKFIDTDDLIINTAEKSIKQIFSEDGEIVFREIETKIIEQVSKENNTVISTGGGAVLKEINIKNLQNNGILFYLYASPEQIFERIKGDSQRPLLNTENPVETLRNIQIQREKYYNQANFKISTGNKTVNIIADEIIEIIKDF